MRNQRVLSQICEFKYVKPVQFFFFKFFGMSESMESRKLSLLQKP